MIDVRTLAEADRQLTVCNACRYCEGVCPVFPALERRETFGEGDVVYLANLCHDCRVCFDVCPYSPPHDLEVNIPKLMAEVREQSYEANSVPTVFGSAFRRGGPLFAGAAIGGIVVILALIALFRPDKLLTSHVGPGAFYDVIPWLTMVIPALLAGLYGVAVMAIGAVRFWRETEGPLGDRIDLGALVSATLDVLGLRQMQGGGPGCTYPEGHPNHVRLISHQLVFYGFGLTFLSTTLAAFWQDILNVLPPYPLLHPVVVTGTIGGIAQIAGCVALLALKTRSRGLASSARTRRLDIVFIVALLVVNVTGLALLAFRESAGMGPLLAIHLGSLVGLFVAMPYGKFVHAVYRYTALLRYRQEERQERIGELALSD
ncbi:MAG TPA: tricarballylate utilization 4Fe-4S protein TcuB [Candidatus Limnocylindrales bacterium]|nr:tricarballylate utilization 4Fe-4S protein TcuB [Candidatus Limnocylindrales bacterium]